MALIYESTRGVEAHEDVIDTESKLHHGMMGEGGIEAPIIVQVDMMRSTGDDD